MKHFLRIIIILAVFLVSQVIAAVVALAMAGQLVTDAQNIEAILANIDPVAFGRATLMVYLVTIVVLWATGLAGRRVFARVHHVGFSSAVLAIFGFFLMAQGLSLVAGLFDLDDKGTTAMFGSMLGDPLCVLGLCVVIPALEEMVFRAGILREMTASGIHPVIAVITSAAAFGVLHGNLQQSIPAVIMGVVLGWLYVRSGNLRLCLAAHIVNNAAACAEMKMPEMDGFIAQMSTPIVATAGLALFAAGLLLLYKPLCK